MIYEKRKSRPNPSSRPPFFLPISPTPFPFCPISLAISSQFRPNPPNSSFAIPFLLVPLPSHNIPDPLRTTSYYQRLSQLAELSHSKFVPQLFPHNACVKFFVAFATKVPYLTFCDKMRRFLIQEMDREGGNKERMKRCRE